MAALLCGGGIPQEPPGPQIDSLADQQPRPEARHAFEIEQIERVEQQYRAQADEYDAGQRNVASAAAQVEDAGVFVDGFAGLALARGVIGLEGPKGAATSS